MLATRLRIRLTAADRLGALLEIEYTSTSAGSSTRPDPSSFPPRSSGSAGAKVSRVERPAPLPASVPLFERADGIAVARPSDGMRHAQTYSGSGSSTSQAVMDALAARGVNAFPGAPAASPEDAAAIGSAKKTRWIVMPTIQNRKGRPTEWSGRPDRVRLLLRTIEGSAAVVCDTSLVEGTSTLFTFDGDRAEHMLLPAVDDWARGITRP